MNTTLSLADWLAQNPLPEEIRYNEDQSAYIPYEFIEPKLDYLSPTWGTENFNHFLFTTPDGRVLCSGGAELVIEYKEHLAGGQCNIVKRRITGGATFDTQRYFPNSHWGAICLSLCTVSAAKKIGRFFGKELNKGSLTVPTISNGIPAKNDKLKNTINSAIKQFKKADGTS